VLFLCFAASFLASFGQSLVFLALPLLAIERFGALNFHLGLLGAGSAGVYTIVSLSSGRISEHLPTKIQLPISAFVLALAAYSMLLAPSLTVLFVLNVVVGVTMGLMWAPLESVVSRLSPPGKIRRNMGHYNLAWSAGMTVGFFAFARLEPVAFQAGAFLIFLVGLIFLILRAPEPKRVVETADRDPASSLSSDGRRRFFLLTAWSALFAAYVGVGAARQLFPKLATELSLSGATIGRIYGVGLLAQTITMATMGWYEGWHYKKRAVYLGEMGLAAAGLLIGFGRTPLAFGIGHIALGIAMAVVYSCSLYYSMEYPREAHRNTSVHEGLIGIAMTTPLLMGYAADRAHFTPLSFFIAAGLASVFLAVQLVLLAIGKGPRPTEPLEAG